MIKMLTKKVLSVILISCFSIGLLMNPIVAQAATSKATKATTLKATARGRSDGPYAYKNMYGFKAGTYTYYNSEQCLNLAKYFGLQATITSGLGTKMAASNLNWQGEGVSAILIARGSFTGLYVAKFYEAASKNGAIVYTTAGNALVKIDLQ
ncbi:hypothetical protein [Desulfosporosinus sp. Sb-LF]|uniref:hypothetical protein n=1 Tax=Desulfosporosinus sp. Sb-LF TaxID=2560027 RepID=UPI00107FAA18|nr:hypothetical protein [Desulfosporosinus sp. Sb-LF]TGE31126.1 hypothetical protein E4K68_18990 [Desulfosporosinus sp. Sb-LF]